VGLGLQRIPKEYHHVYALFNYRSTYLKIAPQRATVEAMHIQANFVIDEPACGARTIKIVLGEEFGVVFTPINQVGFAVVVGNQCNILFNIHFPG
jgi:hypothetical protein